MHSLTNADTNSSTSPHHLMEGTDTTTITLLGGDDDDRYQETTESTTVCRYGLGIVAALGLILAIVVLLILVIHLREYILSLRLTNINDDTLICEVNETILNATRLRTGQILGGMCALSANASDVNVNATICEANEALLGATYLADGKTVVGVCFALNSNGTLPNLNNGSLTCPGEEIAVSHTVLASGLVQDPFCLLPVTLETRITTINFNSTLGNLTLLNSGATPGTYGGNGTFTQFTVNAQGIITFSTNGSSLVLYGTPNQVIVTNTGGTTYNFSTPQDIGLGANVRFGTAYIGEVCNEPPPAPDTYAHGIIISGNPAVVDPLNVPSLSFRMCSGLAPITTMQLIAYDYSSSIIGMNAFYDSTGVWQSVDGVAGFIHTLAGQMHLYAGTGIATDPITLNVAYVSYSVYASATNMTSSKGIYYSDMILTGGPQHLPNLTLCSTYVGGAPSFSPQIQIMSVTEGSHRINFDLFVRQDTGLLYSTSAASRPMAILKTTGSLMIVGYPLTAVNATPASSSNIVSFSAATNEISVFIGIRLPTTGGTPGLFRDYQEPTTYTNTTTGSISAAFNVTFGRVGTSVTACFWPVTGIVAVASSSIQLPVGTLQSIFLPTATSIVWTIGILENAVAKIGHIGWDGTNTQFYLQRVDFGGFATGLGGLPDLTCINYLIAAFP